MSECFISIDVETSGPIPGPHFMMSLGAVAFDAKGQEVDSFGRNLLRIDGSDYDQETLSWWKSQPAAHKAATDNPQNAARVMVDFRDWLMAMRSRVGPVVAVGYPILFDGMWVHWYMMRFVSNNPLSFSGVDIKTLAWAKLGGAYRSATKKNMPKEWFYDLPPHNHLAVDDAREQGRLFFNIRGAP